VITERADRMGFGTPDQEMIRGPLASHVEASLLDSGLLESGAVRPAAARRFHGDFARGRHEDHRAIWRLYCLARWSRRFGVSW
jgi:hypothetical protein